MSASTLQKVVIHRRGGYEQLRIETHPTPTPNAEEVLVDVAAIGVNYADCVVRMGLYSSAREYVGWPITPGFEFAGYVREDPQGRLAQGTPLLGSRDSAPMPPRSLCLGRSSSRYRPASPFQRPRRCR